MVIELIILLLISMSQVSKKPVSNTFLDIVCLGCSFFMSIPRSFFLLFRKDYSISKNTLFYNFLDILFRRWPKYFWDKPSGLKLTSFFSDIYQEIFKK